MNELRLEAAHTHLYPGLEGSVLGALPAADEAATCQVTFSDGAMALGSLTVTQATEAILETDPYATAAGTTIPAKQWRLSLCREDEGPLRFRVRARFQPPA